MAGFTGQDLRGARFAAVDLTGAEFSDVGPLVEAELDRRYPERAAVRPADPAGSRHAWDVVERLWEGTVARARRLDPALLHERRDRTATVREVVDGLTDASPAAQTPTPTTPGWPRPGSSHSVRECLLVVLDEEWEHRLYAERDLAVLESRG